MFGPTGGGRSDSGPEYENVDSLEEDEEEEEEEREGEEGEVEEGPDEERAGQVMYTMHCMSQFTIQ